MTWSEFYRNFLEWSDSTVRTRISALEDMGCGDEVVDAVLNLPAGALQSQLIRKAIRMGVKFSRDHFMMLEGELTDEVYKELAAYTGYDTECPEPDEDPLIIPDEPQQQESGSGFFGTLFALLGILGGGAGGPHDHGRCDGDCANCPPHYGYRHGRWYYGRGHQYGCQRGGNGGASGKTFLD